MQRLRWGRLLACTGRLARERARRRARLCHRPVRHRVGTAAIRVCGRLPVTLFTGSGASPCVCVWFCRPALDNPGWAACPLPVRPAIAAGRGAASAVRRLAPGVAGVVSAGRTGAAALATAWRKSARQACQDDNRTDPAGKWTHTNGDALGQMRFASACDPSSRCFGSMIRSGPARPRHRFCLPGCNDYSSPCLSLNCSLRSAFLEGSAWL